MGILNVTPDSFSDGGLWSSSEAAVKRGQELVEEGATYLDVGGESTRPGFVPVSVSEEIARVVPVIQALSQLPQVTVSVDTSKAKVAEAALASGARIVNDVSGLSDCAMGSVVREHSAGYVLMHCQDVKASPLSATIPLMKDWFKARIDYALDQGISPQALIIDPGIGFGKTQEQNLQILRQLGEFRQFGFPVLLGMSRKSLLGVITGNQDPAQRDSATIGAALATWENWDILRVHSPQKIREAWQVFAACRQI